MSRPKSKGDRSEMDVMLDEFRPGGDEKPEEVTAEEGTPEEGSAEPAVEPEPEPADDPTVLGISNSGQIVRAGDDGGGGP